MLLLPLDVVGGLEVVRDRPSPLRCTASWLRAVLVQWLWFAVAVAMLLRTAQQLGTTVALLVFALLQQVLLSRQGLFALLVGGVRMRPLSSKLSAAASAAGIAPSAVREIAADDRSFVGGWTGADARRLWVAERWVTALSADQLAVALSRRAGVRTLGLRRRGVLVALAWNTIGFALAVGAPHASLVTAAGFVVVMAWFTLWQFVGVLVLPSFSRPAVLAADRWARGTHVDTLVASTITQLDRWQDDEAERGPRVEAVFHPVPSRGALQSWAPVGVGDVAWRLRCMRRLPCAQPHTPGGRLPAGHQARPHGSEAHRGRDDEPPGDVGGRGQQLAP